MLLFCFSFFSSNFLKKIVDSKRKGDDLDVNSANKSRKIERKCVDLIVLGIPWKSTDEIVKRYFEQYGDVVLCEVICEICELRNKKSIMNSTISKL